MIKNVILCEEQELCPDFKWTHKKRVHHIRLTEKCLNWDGNCCKLLDGSSCDLEKIKRIKGE